MEKQQLLEEIRNSLASGAITAADLASFSAQPAPVPQPSRHLGVSQVMYYLGGAIVFLGIAILLNQNWDNFGAAVKIMVTLGSAAAAFAAAALLFGYPNFKGAAQAFFLIAGLVLPLGMYVTADKLGWDVSANAVQLLIWLLMSALFLGAFMKYRTPVLSLFATLYFTGVFSLAVDLVAGQNFSQEEKVWQYKILAVGLAYMSLGYYLSQTAQKALTGFLYGFGVLFFLGSAMALGGWNPSQNVFWELAFPFLVFGVILSSVYLKSKSFLVFGSLFLVGYIFKLTGEYFQESLGWPLALVIAGFLVMLVGYYAVELGRKYFPKAA